MTSYWALAFCGKGAALMPITFDISVSTLRGTLCSWHSMISQW
jgi:hypothetical protein